jgi:hypothetical protein
VGGDLAGDAPERTGAVARLVRDASDSGGDSDQGGRAEQAGRHGPGDAPVMRARHASKEDHSDEEERGCDQGGHIPVPHQGEMHGER